MSTRSCHWAQLAHSECGQQLVEVGVLRVTSHVREEQRTRCAHLLLNMDEHCAVCEVLVEADHAVAVEVLRDQRLHAGLALLDVQPNVQKETVSAPQAIASDSSDRERLTLTYAVILRSSTCCDRCLRRHTRRPHRSGPQGHHREEVRARSMDTRHLDNDETHLFNLLISITFQTNSVKQSKSQAHMPLRSSPAPWFRLRPGVAPPRTTQRRCRPNPS